MKIRLKQCLIGAGSVLPLWVVLAGLVLAILRPEEGVEEIRLFWIVLAWALIFGISFPISTRIERRY